MEQPNMNENDKLESKVAAANKALSPAKQLNITAKKWFAGNKSKLIALLGSHQEAQRMFLACMNSVARNPQLLSAEPISIFKSLLQCAELKLYPGPLNEAAIVPFFNNKTKRMEAQFMPQYQGLIKLAYNSGFVSKIRANVVYANDQFNFVDGSETKLTHVPFLDGERGELIRAYAIVSLKWGDEVIHVMNKSEVEAIKARSRASKEKFSPWASGEQGDLEWMWKKTVLKQALKLIPKSADVAQAVELDNRAERPDLAPNEPLIDFDEAAQDELPE